MNTQILLSEGLQVRGCDANISYVPAMIFQCRDTKIVEVGLHCHCCADAFAGPFALVLLVESGFVSS